MNFPRKTCAVVFLFLPILGFAQASAVGSVFADPSFGTGIRRLSNVFPGTGSSLIYGINGLWNADANLYAHNIDTHGTVDIINTNTGATVASGVPFNPSGESSFDPVSPDIFYYKSGQNLLRYSVSTKTSNTVKTFSGTLENLGGSSDFIDRTGRYFLLNVAGQLQVWDKQNDVLYSGSIPATVFSTSGGWAGISPDGNFIIVTSGWNHLSYKLDHANRRLETSGVLFWALCGDHGDIVSPSDGKTYEITADCYDSPDAYLVDVASAKFPSGTLFAGALHFDPGQIDNQKSENTKLFSVNWQDAMHFSCAGTSDWCYVSIESQDDGFSGLAPARPFKSEIARVKATPPYTVEHLAHHGSLGHSYTASVRVNSSPDGSKAMFASDFGRDNGQTFGYSDIYVLEAGSSAAISGISPAMNTSGPSNSGPVANRTVHDDVATSAHRFIAPTAISVSSGFAKQIVSSLRLLPSGL